jgi:hypothetical protein
LIFSSKVTRNVLISASYCSLTGVYTHSINANNFYAVFEQIHFFFIRHNSPPSGSGPPHSRGF